MAEHFDSLPVADVGDRGVTHDLHESLTAAHPIQSPIDEYDYDREWRREGVFEEIRSDAARSLAAHVVLAPPVAIFWLSSVLTLGWLDFYVWVLAFFASPLLLGCGAAALIFAGTAFAHVCWNWSLLDWRHRLWGAALWTIDCTLCAFAVWAMLF